MSPPERFGPMPKCFIVGNEKELLDNLVEQIAQVAAEKPANQIGVLAANWDTLKGVEQRLRQRGIPTAPAEPGAIRLFETTVKLLTMKSVKGLDFPYVFVIGPKARDLGGPAHATLPETCRTLYVALTRASEQLTIGIIAGIHHPLLERLDDSYYEAHGTYARSFINSRGVTIDAAGVVTVA